MVVETVSVSFAEVLALFAASYALETMVCEPSATGSYPRRRRTVDVVSVDLSAPST